MSGWPSWRWFSERHEPGRSGRPGYPMSTRRKFLITSGQGLSSLAVLSAAAIFPGSAQGLLTSKAPAPAAIGLDDKIGQMVLSGFRGMKLDPGNPILADIRERHIGGVVLFDYDVPSESPVRNIESPPQVKDLTAALKEASPFSPPDRGRPGRRKSLAPQGEVRVPGNRIPAVPRNIGSIMVATRKSAEEMAKTLAECGFNINFSPVVDLNVNPENPVIGGRERSFSADPLVVTKHADRSHQGPSCSRHSHHIEALPGPRELEERFSSRVR